MQGPDMWIDLHAHLYDKSDDELMQCFDNARQNNVDIIINTPTSIETTYTILDQIQGNLACYGTVGISPFDVEDISEGWLEKVKEFMAHKQIIGIGEIGLDNSNPRYPPVEKQLPVFEQFLEIAHTNSLPVVMHSRGAEKEALALCKDHAIAKAVFHCYTGGRKVLRQLLDAGYYVSYSGIVTFKNNPLEPLVRYTPMEQLFIETDTPYLAPEPFRGKQNEPAYVPYIGEKIAAIKGIPVEDCAFRIRHNFSELFNISISDT